MLCDGCAPDVGFSHVAWFFQRSIVLEKSKAASESCLEILTYIQNSGKGRIATPIQYSSGQTRNIIPHFCGV